VSARGIRRCRPEVESAVYFTCLAAMDSAAKHAGPAMVSIRAWDSSDALHFTVCGMGSGFDPRKTPAGAGLTSMRDRISALGGTLLIVSGPSRGTRVHGTVPDLDGGAREPATTATRVSKDPCSDEHPDESAISPIQPTRW
jgi:glucose-6-phosphate-specific signal transduction histidine kinase